VTSLPSGTSRLVDLDGPTHYLDLGGPADGPMMVAVHGLGGAAWNWLAVAPRLTRRCRLLAIDLAGHGRSPAAGRATTVIANRRLLDRFLHEVVGEPTVLIGNSMGGLITLLEAAKSPDLVHGAVLIDPALPRPLLSRVDPVVALSFAVMAVPGVGGVAFSRRRGRQTPERLIEETLRLCTVDPARVPLDVVREGIRTLAERDPADFPPRDVLLAARSLLRLLARPEAAKRLFRQITAPVLLLHGDHDRLVSIDVARAAAREFPAWRFEVAGDIGHVPMLEAPDWTADLILDWLEHDAKLIDPA
jgi:pimeloyl-ACP methyl ester carboxylesterase